MNLINTRDTWPTADVVQGTLTLPDGTVIQTLQHDPCPNGVYQLVPHKIANGVLSGIQTYALVNPELGVFHEPDDAVGYNGDLAVRIAILFHPGNWPHNSLGCILPGMTRNSLQPTPSVGESGAAFKRLMTLLGIGVGGHTWTIQGVAQ